MGLCGTDQDKKRLITRLHPIEGQVRGLSKMVEQDKDYIDVLLSIRSSARCLAADSW